MFDAHDFRMAAALGACAADGRTAISNTTDAQTIRLRRLVMNGELSMQAQYSIQFQDKRDPKKRMRETTFADFLSLYSFVAGFDEKASTDAIQIHLPWHSSDEERRRIASLGYELN